MSQIETIRKIPRFSGLPAEAETWLAERLIERVYHKGEMIFMEGDHAAFLHLVLTGEVKVFKVLESGRELILNLFTTGESFGEVALVDDVEFPASATAQEETTVVSLTRRDYLILLDRFPEAARSIIRDLSMRINAMRQRVEVLGEAGVPSRIAQLFHLYCQQLGKPRERGIFIPVHLSRQELASLVGARIETVIRIMSRWQKERIVETQPDGFLVVDGDALHDLITHEG